ncbi:hypothetical protein FC07_GL000444 [Loigolactobacillus bifermentans DSM 20003]|uniref:DUF4649 domain-containing protein n=2 Tax=Loigolactobacillus bifermentans TaxID=1607 RepID=A0A0R1H8W6_9LACO|nr:hypothetical protein FC07_GL000444 [Loigolactobacillus bifermentans DSM 20003]
MNMLEIHYLEGQNEQTKTYPAPADFVRQQQLEVPDFEDYTKLTKVTVDGEPLALTDATMGGLYNYFIQK